MTGIFVFSSLSAPLGPATGSPWSEAVGRLAHVGEYAGLALLLYRAIRPGRREASALTLALVATVAYAVSDEAHQHVVPGREASLFDLALDTMGGAMALVTWWAWGGRADGKG